MERAWSCSIGSARGHSDGNPDFTNNYQVLAERTDLNWGPMERDRRHLATVSGRIEVPRTGGMTVSGIYRFMSGRPLSLFNSNVDADRNGRLFDPLPAGRYCGQGLNGICVDNKDGRNGAYGPNFAELDLRRLPVRGSRQTARSTYSPKSSTSPTSRTTTTRPATSGRASFLRVNSLVGGGIPRQLQIGMRFGLSKMS